MATFWSSGVIDDTFLRLLFALLAFDTPSAIASTSLALQHFCALTFSLYFPAYDTHSATVFIPSISPSVAFTCRWRINSSVISSVSTFSFVTEFFLGYQDHWQW